MDRAGKFLWLPWLRSQVIQNCRSTKGYLAYWEGSHDGYQRLQDPVTHRRGILRISDDVWLVLDNLRGETKHDYRLHWLFPNWPYTWHPEDGRIDLQTPAGAYCVQTTSLIGPANTSLMIADRDTPRGWRAPYYRGREAAVSLAMDIHTESALYATLFAPRKGQLASEGNALHLEVGSLQLQVTLTLGDSRTTVNAVRLGGEFEDRLDIR
jgi:hypothetical protein